jgi:tetratricopeptide (TPR) repeat protein
LPPPSAPRTEPPPQLSRPLNLEENIRVSRTALENSTPAGYAYACPCGIDQYSYIQRSDQYPERIKELADALGASWEVSHLVNTLEEAISLYERLVDLRPPGHERRRDAVNDLGTALWRFCAYHPADRVRSDRCFKMYREGMKLCPPGHPLRPRALHNLARALLFISFDLLGNEEALAEAIILAREALTLRPPGHPDRSQSLNTLASALKNSFELCGDYKLLQEAISMHREVVELRPPGQWNRDGALSNLGSTLITSFNQQGDFEAVTEALSVLREALGLRPVGNPLRFWALASLAECLTLRFLYQGFSDCLSEAIDLYHEVLHTMPSAHPQRAKLMIIYADTLVISFQEHHDFGLLSEAISVLRGALDVLPQGFYLRDSAVGLLAGALHASCDHSGDMSVLLEVKALHQEALQLRPPGHPRRIASLEGLADFYCKVQPPSWNEAYTLYCEALRTCPQGYPTRAQLLSGISRCFLDVGSPFFDPEQGITHLSEAYADNLTHITRRLRVASTDLRRVEATYTSVTRCLDEPARVRYGALVLELYSQIIGLLPRAANFGIDPKARLRAVAGTDKIARIAAARALLVGRISMAIETLEEGRGVFWAQTLHLRTSAFHRVPGVDREELQRLLLQLDTATRVTERSDLSGAQRERELAIRHQLNEKAESLISKIRGYPGLDRFLLPSAFDAIFASLPGGFVVIVNTSEVAHHALLLHRPTGLATSVSLNFPYTGFDSTSLKAKLPRDGASTFDVNSSRAIRLNTGATDSLDYILGLLWTSIVWPVISRLGLEVG